MPYSFQILLGRSDDRLRSVDTGGIKMFVVTNREVIEDAKGIERFGKRPNAKGPNELTLAELVKRGSRWNVQFLDDELEQEEVD